MFENEKWMKKDGMENYTWIKRWMIEVDGEKHKYSSKHALIGAIK
jgi:hypothetical protein